MFFLHLDPFDIVYGGAAALSIIVCCMAGCGQYRRMRQRTASPPIRAGLLWPAACLVAAALVVMALWLGLRGL